MVEKKYGLYDKDSEHLSKSEGVVPPRVVGSAILERFGFSGSTINLIGRFMKDNRKEGNYFQVKMSPYVDLQTGRDPIESPNACELGKVDILIDASIGSGLRKRIDPFNNKQAEVCMKVLAKTLIQHLEQMWHPKYAHFIASRRDFKDLPFPYIEIIVKAENTWGGNIFGDFTEGCDVDNQGITTI